MFRYIDHLVLRHPSYMWGFTSPISLSVGVPSNTTYVCSVISPVQPRGVYTYVSEPLVQGTRDP
jgi:hypothetical protein